MRGFRRLLLLTMTAAIAAGLCAPGALSAASPAGASAGAVASKVSWSPRHGPVPGAATTMTPALTAITFPGSAKPAALLFWSQPRPGAVGDQISYASATSLGANKWTDSAAVSGGKASTDQSPAVAPYGTTGMQVIVAWKTPGPTGQVRYTIGTAQQGGLISWGAVTVVPGVTTPDAPALETAVHSHSILLAWRTVHGHHIGYAVGSLPGPAAGAVTWSSPATIPGAFTADRPDIAEVSTGAKTGILYVLWRGVAGSDPIKRVTTADPLSDEPKWTRVVSFPATVRSGTAPGATASYRNGNYPLVVAYRVPHGTTLKYVTLVRGKTGVHPRIVPGIQSRNAPLLADGLLFARAVGKPTIYYLWIRPCPLCARA
jgi:hypothetical protein